MKILVSRSLFKLILLIAFIFASNILLSENISIDYEFDDEISWAVAENYNIDILEPINRPIYYFNDFLYQHFFNPINNIYIVHVPKGIRVSIKNFFTNLKYPVRFFSNILQFKIKESYYESLKFGINSTVGIFGINTPADKFSVLNDIPEEDFGQVLAFWGIPKGPFIMVPILGPSTLRDLPASMIDRKLNFIDVNSDNWGTVKSEWIILLNTSEILSINEEMLPKYDKIKMSSLDVYTAIRSAYLQQRDNDLGE